MPQINNLNAPKAAAPRKPLLGVAREDVTFGQVFKRYNSSNVLGDKAYGSIGNNGRMYSINLDNGEVAAADDGSARVKVVGSFVVNGTVNPKGSATPNTRGRLATTAMFKVKGGKKMYANLGQLNDGRFISLNPQSHDYVVSKTGRSNKSVVQIGTYSIDWKQAC